MIDNIKLIGSIDLIIDYENGRQETMAFLNSVVRTGRYALAKSLANEYGNDYEFFISTMVFGNGGTDDGTPRFVGTLRNGLFGTTVASKSASSVLDVNDPSQVIFTSIISRDEANGQTLNEMALRMYNGDFYSMATFPDIGKTSAMQLTFNWRINFV